MTRVRFGKKLHGNRKIARGEAEEDCDELYLNEVVLEDKANFQFLSP